LNFKIDYIKSVIYKHFIDDYGIRNNTNFNLDIVIRIYTEAIILPITQNDIIQSFFFLKHFYQYKKKQQKTNKKQLKHFN